MTFPIFINFECEVDRESLMKALDELQYESEGPFEVRKLSEEEVIAINENLNEK